MSPRFAKLPEAAGAPRPASLLHRAGAPRACCGFCAAPPPGPRPPGSPALPIPSLRPAGPRLRSAAAPPPPHPWGGRRLVGPSPGPGGRFRGARRAGRSWQEPSGEHAGLGGHLKTSPQPEDGGGDWPGAALCASCAGWSGHTALGTGYPSSEPAPCSKARHPALLAWGQSPRICCLGTRWACWRGWEGGGAEPEGALLLG